MPKTLLKLVPWALVLSALAMAAGYGLKLGALEACAVQQVAINANVQQQIETMAGAQAIQGEGVAAIEATLPLMLTQLENLNTTVSGINTYLREHGGP